ncbi:hypothetical protein HaLaN_27454, partial [Haematococcus lacustris]
MLLNAVPSCLPTWSTMFEAGAEAATAA